MESLFNTTLIVDGKPVDYTVFFRNDAYHFVSPEGVAEEIILKKSTTNGTRQAPVMRYSYKPLPLLWTATFFRSINM